MHVRLKMTGTTGYFSFKVNTLDTFRLYHC